MLKGFLCYKTITSRIVPSEAQVKIFFFRSKVMFRSQDIQVFVFLTIYDLTNLWRPDQY